MAYYVKRWMATGAAGSGPMMLLNALDQDVKIVMSGKFLPFKYYGATGNELAYGLKEE